jgi:hypothetical protein
MTTIIGHDDCTSQGQLDYVAVIHDILNLTNTAKLYFLLILQFDMGWELSLTALFEQRLRHPGCLHFAILPPLSLCSQSCREKEQLEDSYLLLIDLYYWPELDTKQLLLIYQQKEKIENIRKK